MKTKKQIKALEKAIENVSVFIKTTNHSNPSSIELIFEHELNEDEHNYIFDLIQDFEIWDIYQENLEDTIWTVEQLNELLSDLKIELKSMHLTRRLEKISKKAPEVLEFKVLDQFTRLNIENTPYHYTLASGIFQNDEEGFILFGKNDKLLEKNTDKFPEDTEDTLPVWDYIEEKYNVRIDSFNNDYN